MSGPWPRLCVAILLLGLPLAAAAQAVKIVKPLPGSGYQLQIGGADYVAVTQAQFNDLLAKTGQLEGVIAKLEAVVKKEAARADMNETLRNDYADLNQKCRALTNDSIDVSRRYSEASEKYRVLTNDYQTLVTDYDALAKKYRDIALTAHQRQPIDLGLGVFNTDGKNRAVAMAGAGLSLGPIGLRGWVFGGQDTYGVMAGLSF